MGNYILPPPEGYLGRDIQGTWWLVSSEDWTRDDKRKLDPVLGFLVNKIS